MTNVERKRMQSKFQPTGQWIRREKRLAIYLRDKFVCSYCGRDLHGAAPSEITLDHLIPVSDSGKNSAGNLITACRCCNSARASKTWTAFASTRAAHRITRQVSKDLSGYKVLALDLLARRAAAA